MLKRLEPKTFPITKSGFFNRAAEIAPATSGRLVPIAIIVTPTISDDILNRSAIAIALSKTNVLQKIVVAIAITPLSQIKLRSSVTSSSSSTASSVTIL